MKRPRWIQHLWAIIGRYFWMPCPLCGEMFGGHEWRTGQGIDYIPGTKPGTHRIICPDCQTAGRGRRWSDAA